VANISIGLPYRQGLIAYNYSSRVDYFTFAKHRTVIKHAKEYI